MEQLHLIVEAVVMAFVIGGIVGAIVALNLRPGKGWVESELDDFIAKPIPVRSQSQQHPRRRR